MAGSKSELLFIPTNLLPNKANWNQEWSCYLEKSRKVAQKKNTARMQERREKPNKKTAFPDCG